MRNRFFLIMIFTLSILLLTGCEDEQTAADRADCIEDDEQTLYIGVGWPLTGEDDTFRQGIDLAVEQVNSNGGVLGRELKVIYRDDKAEITEGFRVADSFSADSRIFAVIGHRNSYISLAVSSLYQKAGILMMTPGSTVPSLTEKGNPLLLRTIPSDANIATQAALISDKRGYDRMVIYYEKNDYGLALANAFEDKAQELGITIMDRRSIVSGSESEFRRDLEYFSFLDFDAFFLAGVVPAASDFVNSARWKGFLQPVIGGDGLDSVEFINNLDRGVEDVIAVSIYDPDSNREEVRDFIQDFRQQYRISPDVWAAQGYDAVRLLVYALRESGSTDPYTVSGFIREIDNWCGVTGCHDFDSKGDLVHKDIVIKDISSARSEKTDQGEDSYE